MRATRHHIESLDVFRGLTVAGMILVNNPGNWDQVWPQLLHANWDGCTLADLVFPFFIFISGVAMPFAFSRRFEAGHELRHLYSRVLRRAALLIVLGLILNAAAAFPPLESLRIPGVLQRIALVYLIASFIVLHTSAAGQTAAAAALVLVHWGLLILVPVGGHGAGWLTPENNLAGFIDTIVFGRHTLTPMGDPEGILGTLPAVATALCGALAGHWIRSSQTTQGRLLGLTAGGVTATALGLLWSFVLPLNKSLWTGSFALFTAGLAALLLGASYWLIDVRGVRTWARPFVWLGVNPLAIYFFSELTGHLLDRPWISSAAGQTTAKTWLFWQILSPLVGSHLSEVWTSFLFAGLTVACWTTVAWFLYRKEIRIQV